MTQVTILSGSVVRIWGTLENILARNEGSLSKSDRTMRVVRVELEASKHLVGESWLRKRSHVCIRYIHQPVHLLAKAQVPSHCMPDNVLFWTAFVRSIF